MNEKLFRPQFSKMDTAEKQMLMERLAARYDITFLGLHTFDRWGQNCTTGIFKKDGREYHREAGADGKSGCSLRYDLSRSTYL